MKESAVDEGLAVTTRAKESVGLVMDRYAEPPIGIPVRIHDIERTTEVLAAKVESWVRQHPAQWLWIHRWFKNATT